MRCFLVFILRYTGRRLKKCPQSFTYICQFSDTFSPRGCMSEYKKRRGGLFTKYHIISYCIVYIVSYHAISYHIISYHTSYHIILFHFISFHVMSCHVMSCTTRHCSISIDIHYLVLEPLVPPTALLHLHPCLIPNNRGRFRKNGR